MAFLITSPLINEVAVLLLVSLLGWRFALIYIVVGMAVGIAGGAFLDRIKAERWLADFAADALRDGQQHQTAVIRQWGLRANGTKTYAKEITNCYN
ncbi:hypothetical protein TUM17577_47550 [Enterobacter asburiae]|nr:hypothetical protein TUM17577_47550 [Enterobacter asburiae]